MVGGKRRTVLDSFAELHAHLREDLGPHRLWLIDKIERLNGLLLWILQRG